MSAHWVLVNKSDHFVSFDLLTRIIKLIWKRSTKVRFKRERKKFTQEKNIEPVVLKYQTKLK